MICNCECHKPDGKYVGEMPCCEPGGSHTVGSRLQAVLAALRPVRFAFANEADLQGGIGAALTAAGVSFEPEAILSEAERIDFLVGGLGVEVKIVGSSANVTRQLSRYLLLESIDGVLLITTQMRMARAMPGILHGKPIFVHFIGGGF